MVVTSFYNIQSGEGWGVESGELNTLESHLTGGIQVQFGYSERLSTTKWRFMLQDAFGFTQ